MLIHLQCILLYLHRGQQVHINLCMKHLDKQNRSYLGSHQFLELLRNNCCQYLIPKYLEYYMDYKTIDMIARQMHVVRNYHFDKQCHRLNNFQSFQ